MRKNSIRLRVREEKGVQVFKAIFSHPMETGMRLDKRSGKKIPADYIEDVRIYIDGEIHFEISLGINVSSNPYISFSFARPLVDNQIMQISWQDNHRNESVYETPVVFERGTFYFTGEQPGEEMLLQIAPQAGPVCRNNKPH